MFWCLVMTCSMCVCACVCVKACLYISVSLTGGDPGFDAGDLSRGDVLVQYRFVGFLQQVPHLQAAVFFPDEEHSGPG